MTLPFSIAESARDIAVVELLFATGVRVSELCSLELSDLNIKARYIRVFGKGSKERIVQIENTEVLSALKSYLSVRSKLNPLQGELAVFINRCGRRLSPQSVRILVDHCANQSNANIHVTPHMFRHTFATMLLEEGVDIRYIQNILGHSSILTTQIYTRVSSKKQKSILHSKNPRNRLNVKIIDT
jgi:integrase/recombinase XerD